MPFINPININYRIFIFKRARDMAKPIIVEFSIKVENDLIMVRKLLEDIWRAKDQKILIKCCGDCGQIDRDIFASSLPIVLLCPLRLGVDKINAIYISQLKVTVYTFVYF